MRFADLVPGNEVRVLYTGSRVNGNEPYELELIVHSVSDDSIKFIQEYPINREVSAFDIFEIYKFQRRWRYGTSAEVARLMEVLN